MEKQKIEQILRNFPENVDVYGLIERLHLLDKIELAERQIAAAEGIARSEVEKTSGAMAEITGRLDIVWPSTSVSVKIL